MRKIKIALFLLAMLASAAGGAFVALKVAAGTEIGEMIVQRKIQDRVSEKISRIRATQGDILELAVLESVLTFEQEDDWKNVPAGLGKSVSRAEIPAVFRFFVKISEPISVSAEERNGEILCTVIAPKLQPVLPVAFDTSRIAWMRDIAHLLEWEKLYGFSRDSKEAKQMALELHAARIFDNIEWCDYTAFNEKYRPEVLKK